MLKRKEKAERRHARSADKSRLAQEEDAPTGTDPTADPTAEPTGPADSAESPSADG